MDDKLKGDDCEGDYDGYEEWLEEQEQDEIDEIVFQAMLFAQKGICSYSDDYEYRLYY